MSEPAPETSGPRKSSFGFLTRKIGPVPVWVIILAIVAGYVWYKDYGPGASSTSSTSAAGTTAGSTGSGSGLAGGLFRSRSQAAPTPAVASSGTAPGGAQAKFSITTAQASEMLKAGQRPFTWDNKTGQYVPATSVASNGVYYAGPLEENEIQGKSGPFGKTSPKTAAKKATAPVAVPAAATATGHERVNGSIPSGTSASQEAAAAPAAATGNVVDVIAPRPLGM